MLVLLLALLAFATFSLALPQATTNATATVSSAPLAVSPISALPTKNCISDNFVQPWVINNLVITAPTNTSVSGLGYITFAFWDPNEELQLTTMCIGTAVDGTAQLANGGYMPCEDNSVRFQLEDMGVLLISRWYKDPCKGNPPYDSGIAFGQQDANFQVISSGAGAVHFQQRMEVNVTRMT